VIATPTYVTAQAGLTNASENWIVSHSAFLPVALVQCEAADVCLVVIGVNSAEGYILFFFLFFSLYFKLIIC
jgi:hypothetical protein